MSARRRRGDEEDLSEGEDKEALDEGVTVSDDGSEKAGLAVSESEESMSSEESSSENDEKDETPEVLVEDSAVKEVEKSEPEEELVDLIQEIKLEKATEKKKEEIAEKVEDDANARSEISSVNSQDGVPGEEISDSDKANEDEDERHPAYIPRKGLFFLHDDRIDNDYPEGQSGAKMDLEAQNEGLPTSEQNEEGQNATEEETAENIEDPDSHEVIVEEMDQEAERAMRAARKAERMIEKWSHDKYDDDMQLPRTQQELVDRYGFDIRSLNPEEVDFSQPWNENGGNLSPSEHEHRPRASKEPIGKRDRGPKNARGLGSRRGTTRVDRQNGRGPLGDKGTVKGPRVAKPGNPRLNNDDFPELTITKKNDTASRKAEIGQKKSQITRPTKNDPRIRKGPDSSPVDREMKDMRSIKGRSNKLETKLRKDNRDNFKKPFHEDKILPGRNQRNQRAPRRENDRNDYDVARNEKPQENRLRRKQEQRRRVEAERDIVLNDSRSTPHRNGHQNGRNNAIGQTNGRIENFEFDSRRNNSRQRSPPRQRIEDPAPPIRSRRYSSDLSDEDINERRRPPPPRRKKNQPAPAPITNLQGNKNMKPQLQVEVANVAEILAKHDTQARAKMVAKHAEFEDRRIRESPTKGRRDERKERRDDRRRESDSKIKARPDEKTSKRYSARTRPDHWNRQSPSPPHNNDQNFNDRSIEQDPLQGALEKHFNVSAAQAKKFMNQIKNQLHTVDEVNPKRGDRDPNLRFPHGVTSSSNTDNPISSFADTKSNNPNFKNNIGIRDRTNEQSLAQYQAYQQQQAQIQAQFLQSQAQQNPHPFANDATMVSPSDIVNRMVNQQQDPSWINQQAQQQARQVVPNLYAQQGIYENNQMAQISSPSAYVNQPNSAAAAAMSQQQLASSLISNGTTYFHGMEQQHNRNKY